MRDAAATKRLIEQTALRLFAEKGIAETTIRDIAFAAGVAEGTMYRHYDSKEELAWRLFADNYTEVGRALHEIARAKRTTRDKIESMIRFFCDEYDKDQLRFRYLFLARHGQMRKVTSRMPNPYIVFRSVIREGMARGEIPNEDPDVATSMVMGVILQVIDSAILGQRIRSSLQRIADKIVAACLRVLKA